MGISNSHGTDLCGQVRICVDMRLANEAIRRVRHPTPTVNDISFEKKQERMTEEYVNFITSSSVPKAMTLEEIVTATNSDGTLQELQVACHQT